jgi:diketogulonate reductase-like aldo/keto reductase
VSEQDSSGPWRQLPQGRVPRWMYGTAWKENETERLTTEALRAGFVAIDTANQRRHYDEASVGRAIQSALDSGRMCREDLFLQTKFTYLGGQDHRLPYDPDAGYSDQVEQSFARSLEHLGLNTVDSYVLHGPMYQKGVDDSDREVWNAMEAIFDRGSIRFLGVSNVSADQLETIYNEARIKPTFVQNRCFASTGWDLDVRSFCAHHGMLYQGFSLLTANTPILRVPAFKRIVDRVGRTPAEVIFRFALAVGMIPLTGTTSSAHMRLDLGCEDISLRQDEVRAIETIAEVA